MEPYELSLRQVNFEEKDIKEEDGLDSFGNLVCYDSDFKGDNQSLPVLAKRLIGYGKKEERQRQEEDAKASLIDLIHESKKDYYTYGPGRPDHYSYDYKLPTDDEGHKDSPRSRLSSGSSSREPDGKQSPGGDSFKAFTGTVEALALQNSVIGNNHVPPASPEEVARVIAETQRRLGAIAQHPQPADMPGRPNFSVDDTHENLEVSVSQEGCYDITMTTEVNQQSAHTVVTTTSSHSESCPSHTMNGGIVVGTGDDLNTSFGSDHSVSETVIIHDVEEHSDGLAASFGKMNRSEPMGDPDMLLNMTSPSPQSHVRNISSDSSASPRTDDLDKPLIRVPKENITVEKSSNWFYTRGNSCGNPKLSKEDIVPEKECISLSEEKTVDFKENGETIVEVTDQIQEAQGGERFNGKRNGELETVESEPDSVRKEITVERSEVTQRYTEKHVSVEYSSTNVVTQAEVYVHKDVQETRQATRDTVASIPEVSAFYEFCKADSNASDQQQHDTVKTSSREVAETSLNTRDQSDGGKSTKGDQVNGLKREEDDEVKSTQNHSPVSSESHAAESLRNAGSDVTSHTRMNIKHDQFQETALSVHSSDRLKGKHAQKNFLEVDITESPKNYEKKVKEMELDGDMEEEEKLMSAAKVARSKDLKKLRKELQKIMKVKAKLEGQLEVMEIESKLALQQRADLQSHVAGLKEQMKGHEASVRAAVGERDAVTSDLLTLKQNKSRLEQVIIDAHKLLSDKDEDLKTLNEDIQVAQQANEALQEKIKDLKRHVQSKDSTVQDLKNKIAELYVQFQTTNQTRILLENEIKSVKSEIKSLSTAKDWYQEQLKLAQDGKNQLQTEITSIKGDVIAKSTLIERLKADNVRVKQQLADTQQRVIQVQSLSYKQQRVIQEKQLLAQHLEAIEADMLEREATFTQTTKERDAMQELLTSRGIDHDTARQASPSGDGRTESPDKELSGELDMRRLNNDVKRKQAHIAVLEHEQAELMKRLALSQESILERDKAVESLEKNFMDAEILVDKLQQDLRGREEELVKTAQEKGLVESELSTVKSEKKSFDHVVQNLKEDMTKVERSFRHIKQELARKNEELSQYKSAKDAKNEEIAQVFHQESSNTHSQLEKSETVNESSPEMDRKYAQLAEELENVKSQKVQLEKDLSLVRQESASQVQELLSQKVILENSIASLESRDRQTPERKAEVKTLVQETIKEVEKSREILRQQISSRYVEINKEMLIRQYVKVGSESDSEVIEENNRLKLAIIQMVNNRKGVIDNQLEGLKSELDEVQHAKNDLEVRVREKSSREHELLVTRVSELERELQIFRDNESRSEQEIAINMDLELEKEKGKMAAILQSYEQLKKHAHELEAQMAQKESNTVALNSQAQLDLRGREKLIVDLQENVHTLEQKLQKETSVIKEVKKQLLSEKGGHVKTRRKFESLWVDHDQMRVDYETKIKDLESSMAAVEKSKESEQKYRDAFEKLNGEYQNLKVEQQKLRREFGERQAKDPLVNEQIKSLEWQLKEKDQEVFAAKQQLSLVEDRQSLEAENMKKTVQANASELSKLREQLSSVKREKTLLQTRTTELKTALQNILHTNKHGKNVTLDWNALEKLLQESSSPIKQSKPLSFLQATLSDLRGEISTLQTQMDVHTTALQTSSQSWRDLEQQVKDLREVCKSTAAEREASQDLLSSGAVAAAQSPVAMATQAVARNAALETGTSLIPPPPIPVKLPTELDFSLPPMLVESGSTGRSSPNSVETPVEGRTGGVAKASPGQPREHLLSEANVPSDELNQPEEAKWINTKALMPNSVYSPPTATK